MNILVDRLPEVVKVGGSAFDIETDFRAGISFYLLIEAGENNPLKLCAPFFPNGMPYNISGAVDAVVYFIRGGEEPATDKVQKSSKPAFSYSVDSDAIYADFWRFYNVDLSVDSLHWWTFRSLLMGLPEDSNFKTRIYYRTCNLRDLPKKEQRRIAKIRKEIEIKAPETDSKITLEQRNKNMLDYVRKRTNQGGE